MTDFMQCASSLDTGSQGDSWRARGVRILREWVSGQHRKRGVMKWQNFQNLRSCWTSVITHRKLLGWKHQWSLEKGCTATPGNQKARQMSASRTLVSGVCQMMTGSCLKTGRRSSSRGCNDRPQDRFPLTENLHGLLCSLWCVCGQVSLLPRKRRSKEHASPACRTSAQRVS